MSVLIKNGRIVTAADDYRAEVFIDGETVVVIGRDFTFPADRTIDAAGRLVIPGGVDPHTHMEMPFSGTESSDTFETGTRAAAFGGTTSIVDFAIQTRGVSTLAGLDTWHAKAAGRAAIDYGFHMIVTDLPGQRVPELRRLADEGVTSYKLFMAYPDVLLSNDATIFRALRNAGEQGTLVCMHAENGVVIDELVKIALAEGHVEPKYHALTRPTRLEGEGAHRALAIAEVARAPVYIVHLSCYDALTELRRAQERGVMAHAETCPQYLLLDSGAYDEPDFDGAKYVMTPPLREKWNQDELWRGLRSKDLDVISGCSRARGPLRSARMRISVIFDPEREVTISSSNPDTHHMNIDYSAYEGFRVRGYPETVLSRGRVVIDKGEYVGRPGDLRCFRGSSGGRYACKVHELQAGEPPEVVHVTRHQTGQPVFLHRCDDVGVVELLARALYGAGKVKKTASDVTVFIEHRAALDDGFGVVHRRRR